MALQFALDHPAWVETLTLVAPSPAEGLSFFRQESPSSPWVSPLFELQRDASLDTLDAAYRLLRSLKANRPLLRQALKRMIPSVDYDDGFDALVDDAARMAPEAVVGFLQTLAVWNVQAELGRLAAPALVLWGDRDVVIPRLGVERTVAALPHGRLVIWADVGHAPQLEQPDRFTWLLLELTSQDPAILGLRRPPWLRHLRERLWPRSP